MQNTRDVLTPENLAMLQVIAEAGHLCNLEQPAAYNRALSTFLRRLP